MQVSHQKLQEILDSIKSQVPKSFILMSPNSIGEVVVTCALAKAFSDKYGHPVTLCVRPEHEPLVQNLYPGRFAAVVKMDMELMRAFQTSGFVPNGVINIDYPIVLSPNHYDDGRLIEIHNLIYKRNGFSGLSYGDTWRYMMRLDWDAPLEKPNPKLFESTQPFIEQAGLTSGEYILFQLGNNSNKPHPAKFWESLEQHYQKTGLPILANYQGAMLLDQNLKFNNVQIANVGIVEALALMQHSAITVSGHNGLMLCDVLLEHKAPNAVHHIVNSDQRCEHYNLLRSDWENAFVPFEGKPSMVASASEMVVQPDAISEWYIPTGLSDQEMSLAAKALVDNDKSSTYYIPHSSERTNSFPTPQDNGVKL